MANIAALNGGGMKEEDIVELIERTVLKDKEKLE